jgi:hypothetical protein
MRCIKILLGFIASFFFCNCILSQIDSNKYIRYNPDFKFEEGVFLNIEQVKNDAPVPLSRIISDLDYNDNDFLDKVLANPTIYFYDDLGNRIELSTKKVWGYSRNGYLYIKMEGEFFRITMIGAICHFIANHTTYSSIDNSPYYYNSFSDPYQMGAGYPTTEMRQYLLDFLTGRVVDYDLSGLEALLMQDAVLYDEFMALGKKKKQQMKFVYIRKYNESHPLFFPKN